MQGGAPQRLTCSFHVPQAYSRKKPCWRCMHRDHFGLLSVNMQASVSQLYYTHTPQLRSTRYILSHTVRSSDLSKLPESLGSSLNVDPTIPFWKISRNPTFSVPSNLSLQPSSVVTLVLIPTCYALYGTSFFPTHASSARGTRLAPVSSASGIHAKSRSHVRRKPRHVPIPPFIPSGEHSLTSGTIPH